MINKETSGIKSDPSCETRTDILCEFSPKPYGKKNAELRGIETDMYWWLYHISGLMFLAVNGGIVGILTFAISINFQNIVFRFAG